MAGREKNDAARKRLARHWPGQGNDESACFCMVCYSVEWPHGLVKTRRTTKDHQRDMPSGLSPDQDPVDLARHVFACREKQRRAQAASTATATAEMAATLSADGVAEDFPHGDTAHDDTAQNDEEERAFVMPATSPAEISADACHNAESLETTDTEGTEEELDHEFQHR